MKKRSQKAERVNELIALFNVINRPAKAGKVWVTYETANIHAAMNILKLILAMDGVIQVKKEALK